MKEFIKKILSKMIQKHNDERRRFLIEFFLAFPLFAIKHENNILKLREPQEKAIHILCTGSSLDDTIQYIYDISGDIMLLNGTVSLEELKSNNNVKYIIALDESTLTKPFFEPFFGWWAENKKVAFVTRSSVYSRWKSKYKEEVEKIILSGVNVKKDYNWKNIGEKVVNYAKRGLVCPSVDTGSASLWIAIQLGYKVIYIHGLDYPMLNSVKVDKNNKIARSEYDHSKLLRRWDEKLEESLLVSDRYLNTVGKDNMEAMLLREHRRWLAVYNIKYYADCVGAKIYNMSVNSGVDCFEKIDGRDLILEKDGEGGCEV